MGKNRVVRPGDVVWVAVGIQYSGMKGFKPKKSGEFKVRPGRRVIWLARPSRVSIMLAGAALAAGTLGLIAIGVPVVPTVWYALRPTTVSGLEVILSQPVATEAQMQGRSADNWQPAYDESLPEGNWVGTQKIGLKAMIREAAMDDYETALSRGVWRVPDFGSPADRSLPLILSAHRFGYLKWTNTFRRENSFYNLPKLEVGDRVYVVWEKRKYIYEIYRGDEGREITDYQADLILYTCKFLESPQRIFRYAMLVRE
jgi:hypothetical protein